MSGGSAGRIKVFNSKAKIGVRRGLFSQQLLDEVARHLAFHIVVLVVVVVEGVCSSGLISLFKAKIDALHILASIVPLGSMKIYDANFSRPVVREDNGK